MTYSQKLSSDEISFIIETKGKTVESIKLLSNSLKDTMKKPQKIEIDEKDFYAGVDTYTDTIYICFSNLLMVDVDDKIDIDKLMNEYTLLHPDTLFDVYETNKGYHIFDISKEHQYKSEKSLQMMLELKCDFFYSVYSYLRGWSVRLNKKLGNGVIDGTPLYTFYKRFGNGVPNKKLEGYVKMHDELFNVYTFARFSKMR
jgi:hypothetical protein